MHGTNMKIITVVLKISQYAQSSFDKLQNNTIHIYDKNIIDFNVSVNKVTVLKRYVRFLAETNTSIFLTTCGTAPSHS